MPVTKTGVFRTLIINGIILCSAGNLWSQEPEQQEKEKDLGTEVVNVVKAYTPTVGDAEKLYVAPVLTDSVTTTRKTIQYTINSVPVASTFTPAKGKANVIKQEPREPLFNSYTALGLGNYNTAQVDFYSSTPLNRDEFLDVIVNHHSAQGDIDQVFLDTRFFDTELEGHYRRKNRYSQWEVEGGFGHEIYNWYGVPQGVFSQAQLESIDERQSYYHAHFGGNLQLPESYFGGGAAGLDYFWDGYESTELNVMATPEFILSLGDENLNVGTELNYLNGSQVINYGNDDPIAYSNLIAEVAPSLQILEDDLTIDLGAAVVYNNDFESGTGNFFIYPRVSASYNLVEEYLIPYAGVKGDLQQNTYREFVADNPFVSPTINVTPTDAQYDAYVGVRGKLLPNLSYDLKGSYMAANNQPLFRNNPLTGLTVTDGEDGYRYGNSFGVVYDDIRTLSIAGELNFNLNNDLNVGLNAAVRDYNTDEEAEAWNLPSLEGSLFAEYSFGKKWHAGADFFYIGNRKDRMDTPLLLNPEIVTLDGYFDLNARLSYDISKQLGAFVKLNNMTNNDYARWMNFRVQGFQVLAGASYKFDL